MAYESNAVFWIEVEKVVPNPFQPRREFNQAKLQELADSIKMYGILQPLVVTRHEIVDEDGSFKTEYELVAGERRLRASKLAGLAQVPALIRTGEESQLMKLELAIIENLQREDLNAVDRALAFKQLAEQFNLSHSQVAKKVGRSREYVSNSIRLLQLPDQILDALRRSDISDGHARTLLMLNDRPEEQDVVFREILIKKLSVREVERISRKIASDKVRKKNWQGSDPALIEIEKEFTEAIGSRVQIQKTDFGGRLTIDYFAPEDLHKLLEMVQKREQIEKDIHEDTLSQVTEATPLEEAAVDSVDEQKEEVMPSSPVTLQEVPKIEESEEAPEETNFTRFDSIEAEETIEEIPPSSDNFVEQGAPVVEPAQQQPEDFQIPTSPDTQTENKEKPEQEESTDLYSIKNFSL